jgi:hypothetical protein
MSDGMSNQESYLTQSDDVLRDPRITDDWVRTDALGDLDLEDNWEIHVGNPDWGMEVTGIIDSVSLVMGGTHWKVQLKSLAFPLLIPNNTVTRLDLA